MRIEPSEIPDVKRLWPTRHGDGRGWLAEAWRDDDLAAAGIPARFVQQNWSSSTARGTVRGLHFQAAPAAQGKLVFVVRGSVFDVAVDLRPDSATYRRHVTATLSAADGGQLWIPAGFAHGFCTLEPDTDVIYALTHAYSPAHERGIAWDDPDIAIAWPDVGPVTQSARDRHLPRLRELPENQS